MKKATHTGTCQICGSRQKLPKGKLSLHGYTKRWGFFNGICTGAEHLPFEQDISLIEGAIKNAQNRVFALNNEAADRLCSTDPSNVIDNHYFSRANRIYGYSRVAGRIEERKVQGEKHTWTTFHFIANHVEDEGKKEWELRYAGQGYTLESVVSHLNKQEVHAINETIKQLETYIAWQKARILNWKPSALTLIK